MGKLDFGNQIDSFLNGARLTAPIERVYLLQRKEMYGMPHPVNDERNSKKRESHMGIPYLKGSR